MKFINKIYFHRQGIIFGLLAVYMNLLVVTALHYHAVDFDNDFSKRIETESVQKNSLILSAVHCPVYNFSTSVFQFFVTEKNIISNIDVEIFVSLDKQKSPSLLNKNYQSGRAPPIFI